MRARPLEREEESQQAVEKQFVVTAGGHPRRKQGELGTDTVRREADGVPPCDVLSQGSMGQELLEETRLAALEVPHVDEAARFRQAVRPMCGPAVAAQPGGEVVRRPYGAGPRADRERWRAAGGSGAGRASCGGQSPRGAGRVLLEPAGGERVPEGLPAISSRPPDAHRWPDAALGEKIARLRNHVRGSGRPAPEAVPAPWLAQARSRLAVRRASRSPFPIPQRGPWQKPGGLPARRGTDAT